MYRQGLGDCFLLRFWREGDNDDEGNPKRFHILIDCGVLGNSESDKDMLTRVAENIRDETGNHLNLLIATHRHWDHLAGFLLVQPVFDLMTIDQVWAGWTEDPQDPQARRMWKGADTGMLGVYAALSLAEQMGGNVELLDGGESADNEDNNNVAQANRTRAARKEMRAAVHALMMGFSGDPPEEEVLDEGQEEADAMSLLSQLLRGMLPPLAAGGVRKDPKKAMRYITGRSVRDVDYLEPKDGDRTRQPKTVQGLEGVRFYVLGPPREEDYLRHFNLRKSDPKGIIFEFTGPAFASSFIASVGLTPVDAEEGPASELAKQYLPFDGGHRLKDADPRTAKFIKDHYGLDETPSSTGRWRRIDDDWMDVASGLALWLNSVVNNTSLALAIELVESDSVLMFVADAQIGNWESWGELSWTVRDANGETKKVDIADLFGRTVLYKVGHHGSHNATLQNNGLNLMKRPDLVAMIPVDEDTARAQTNRHNPDGWQMPAAHLSAALEKKARGRVLRADKPVPPGIRGATEGELWIDLELGK
jgi:hypothetical protein